MTSMMMPSRFDDAIAEIDAANSADPRNEPVGGVMRPKELVYSQRMSACLLRIYPQASMILQIAARAQHLCRWQISRGRYPLGREGYNAWRTDCREHHADLAGDILRQHGFDMNEIKRVQSIIKKCDLKSNFESQALENVAGVVFIEFYLSAFLADHSHYDDVKMIGILKKTFRKMDATGLNAIAKLPLSPSQRAMIVSAL